MGSQVYDCPKLWVQSKYIVLQDNKSSILLENNGTAYSGKRTRHMNIRFFNITDWVEKKEAKIMWVTREEMIADYLTKAVQGAEFCRFRV